MMLPGRIRGFHGDESLECVLLGYCAVKSFGCVLTFGKDMLLPFSALNTKIYSGKVKY